MSDTLTVFDPTAPDFADTQLPRRALDSLRGKVIGFVDNAKPNFNMLVDDMRERLMSRHGAAKVVVHRKRGASIPVTPEAIDSLVQECDVIIADSGD